MPHQEDNFRANKIYRKNPPVILLVTRNGHLPTSLMTYAIDVADRLQARILAVYVDTLPLFEDGGTRSKRLASAIYENVLAFRSRAAEKGITINYVREAGKISCVIYRLCHIARNISFIFIDKGISLQEAQSRASVPVFTPCSQDLCTITGHKKEKRRDKGEATKNRQLPSGKCIDFIKKN